MEYPYLNTSFIRFYLLSRRMPVHQCLLEFTELT